MAFETNKSTPTTFSRLLAGEFLGLDQNTATPTESNRHYLYVDGSDNLQYWNGATSSKLNNQAGGGGAQGLDTVYSIAENDVTLDEGAITWTDATSGALNMMEFVKTGAGSGNMLDLSVDAALTGRVIAIDMNLGIAAQAIFIDAGGTARTASDILVNDDSTSTHSVIDINSSGSGITVGYDFTGSFNGNAGGQALKVTLDANDNLTTEIMEVTTGAGNRNVMFDLNFGHADSGTTSHIFDVEIDGVLDSDFMNIAYGAASTGNTFFINLDSAVATTALHIEGSGTRTQPFIELISDAVGAANMIQLSANGAFTGDFIALDMNAALGANAIFLDAGGGIRTVPMILVTMDGAATGAGGTLFDINVTGTGAGANPLFDIDVTSVFTGNIFDIAFGSAGTGDAIVIDMDANVAGSALVLDTGGGTRTDDMVKVTFDGDGQVPFWDINISATGNGATDYWDIDVSSVFVGSILDINYSAAATGDAIVVAMASAVAASALNLSGAGARTDDLIKIDDSSTGNAHIFDINMSGVYTGNVFDVTFSAAATGNVIDLNMSSNVVGMAISVATAATGTSGEGSALDVSHTGDLGAGADLLRVISTGSPSSTSNILSLEQNTGAGTAGANVLHLNATGANVEALEIEAGLMFFATVTANGAGNGETLSTSANISFYDPDGASRTGVILAIGLRDGQHLKVVNFANAAEDITFAVSGTSNVAGGTSIVISRFEITEFVWHAGTSLWYAGKLT